MVLPKTMEANMPNVRYDEGKLKTSHQVAVMCGMEWSTFWRRVCEQHLFPQPTVKRGLRFYYTPRQVQSILDKVQQLRSEGTIK